MTMQTTQTTTYAVEKAAAGERVFVSCKTTKQTAQAIWAAIITGFVSAGYVRSNDEIDKPLPSEVEILRKGSRTVAFRVVAHE